MSGFRDFLRFLLGWWSAAPSTTPTTEPTHTARWAVPTRAAEWSAPARAARWGVPARTGTWGT